MKIVAEQNFNSSSQKDLSFIILAIGYAMTTLVYVEWAKKMVPCKICDDFWRPI